MRNLFFLFVIAVFATSCGTGRLARRCAQAFPTRDPDTVQVVRMDTVEVVFEPAEFYYFDTVPCPPGLTDTLLVYREKLVRGPKEVVKVEVQCVDTIITQADPGLLAELDCAKSDLLAAQSEIIRINAKLSARKVWPYWLAIILLSVAVGWFISRRRK